MGAGGSQSDHERLVRGKLIGGRAANREGSFAMAVGLANGRCVELNGDFDGGAAASSCTAWKNSKVVSGLRRA
jgi:hypothetical protein